MRAYNNCFSNICLVVNLVNEEWYDVFLGVYSVYCYGVNANLKNFSTTHFINHLVYQLLIKISIYRNTHLLSTWSHWFILLSISALLLSIKVFFFCINFYLSQVGLFNIYYDTILFFIFLCGSTNSTQSMGSWFDSQNGWIKVR